MKSDLDRVISFQDFELDTASRQLLKNGEPVSLRPKTLDLLITLIENQGKVLTKGDLLEKVWENQFVEENNLTVHIATLRKALGQTKTGPRFIVTVPGKGYSFVADLNNGPEEIIVESHKFERILIEEEIEEAVVPAVIVSESAEVAARSTSSAVTSPRSVTHLSLPVALRQQRLAIAALAVIMIALTGFGASAWLKGRNLFSNAVPFSQTSVRQLTTTGNIGNAALSPDGRFFAYSIDEIGGKSLWLGDVAGGNHILLSPPREASYYQLEFSADGNHIYFTFRDSENPTRTLYRMPAFGGAREKVIEGISNFAIAPDGRQIAFGQKNDEGMDVLVISDMAGRQRREAAVFGKDEPCIFSSLSWSPDSWSIAMGVVISKAPYINRLALLDVSNGQVKHLPKAEWREIKRTAWLNDNHGIIVTALDENARSSVSQYRLFHVDSKNGQMRLITRDMSNYGPSWHNDAGASLSLIKGTESLLTIEHRQVNNVWVAPADNLADARQITFGSFGKYDGLWGLDWTVDGRLVYADSDTRSYIVSIMNADDGETRPLTSPGVIDSVLNTSNDGRHVVFHSNRGDGDFDIWRMNTEGSDPVRLTFGGTNYQPFISADSRWVYYKSFEKGDGSLRRVPIDGGEPEILNDKETSWGSFAPDGEHFAALYRTDKSRLAIFSAVTHEVVQQFDLPRTATVFGGTRWTPDGTAVVYRDLSYGYWMQPVDGGEPRRLENLPNEKFYNFSWSKDGKWFAFVAGQELRDVVLIENSVD